MKLLLARHGNTFEAGETPRIVGRSEDLPLTQKGEAQAGRLAAMLRAEDLMPTIIRCGDLQRTRRMAEIIGSVEPIIDPRLTELDYGDWAGLTTDEVRARFGGDEVDAWDHHGIMPQDRKWQPTREDLQASVNSFANEGIQNGGTTLGITSNGVLRFFAMLVEGLFDELAAKRQLKIGTGNLCALEYNDIWQLEFWNKNP